MTDGNDFDLSQPQTIFAATLTPHRSLSRRGFVIFMTVVALASFAAGAVFWLMGAWPVFGFFGLDVVLIYWAFRVNFARAKAREEITVTVSELHLRRISHRGQVMEWSFNPLWVRLEEEVHEEFGVEHLYLASHGRRVAIGRDLGPDQKASFAKALRIALQSAKRGPTYNPIS